jgi:tripartite ATP-independent transporter DctM subunit
MMGLIGYPSMAKRGYSDRMVVGAIMAGGALGVLIPPSVVLIVYGLIAQESVGRLFLGGVFPGFLLAALFVVYVLVRSWHDPRLGPPVPPEERATFGQKLAALKDVAAPMVLVVVVLGSMFFGLATPTEAAAIGAAGAIVSALFYRRFSFPAMQSCAEDSLRIVAMIMWIILSAEVFAAVYSGIGATKLIQNLLTDWEVSRWVVLILMQVIWIFLGMLMEALSVLLITAPIFVPVAKSLGFDPVWFGILFVVNMEMGFLTPPFGINLFVMKGILKGTRVTTADVYLGALPFVGLQLLGLAVVMLFPALATWLPNLVFNR